MPIQSVKCANQQSVLQVITFKKALTNVSENASLNTSMTLIKLVFQPVLRRPTMLQIFTWTIILTCVLTSACQDFMQTIVLVFAIFNARMGYGLIIRREDVFLNVPLLLIFTVIKKYAISHVLNPTSIPPFMPKTLPDNVCFFVLTVHSPTTTINVVWMCVLSSNTPTPMLQ